MKQQRSTSAPDQGSFPSEPLKLHGGTMIPETHRSPLRLLIVTIVAIFIAEVVAMIVVYALDPVPYYQTTLLDAGIMTILIFPVLYYLSFRPLLQHIDKSRQAENRLRRVNRTLFVLNECNQALVHAEKEYEFLQRMCEILVTIGEYRLAWIGFAEHDQSRSVRPAAQAGFENGYLDLAQITWDDTDRGQGPTGTAIRQGAVQVNQNFLTNPKMAPWRESAELRGYQSSIALPLQNGKSTIGALTIYSALPDAFDEEEVRLLIELANDLAFGITALRVRSERNQAEELNRQLSRIVDQTEDTVVVTNCQGLIEYVNPAFERLTGYTKEEALGKTPRVLKSGVHNGDFYQELWGTILRGDVFQSEVANRRKNGQLFYEVKTITPLRDTQGNITHFVATGKDITEHKLDEEKLQNAYVELELRVQERTEQLLMTNAELEEEVRIRRQTEEALLQSEFGLKRAQEIAHLGNWELNLVNNRLTWSDEVYRIFGLQPQEFRATYDAFLEAVHPDDRAAVDHAYSRSILEGWDSYEIEHRIVKHSNREIRVVHEKCEHFRDEAGQIVRSVGMVHDITERKQAEKRLAYLASFPERNPNPVIEVDFDGQVYYANAAALSILPDLADRGLAHPWLGGLPNVVGAFHAGQSMATSHDVTLGEQFFQQTLYLLAEDRLVRIYGTDITERKNAEEALRRSEALLLQTGQMAKVGGWELDLQTMAPYWSLETYRIHDVDPSVQPRLEDAIDFYAPEARPIIQAAVQQAIEAGSSYDLELPIVTAKGKSLWIRTIGESEFRDGKCVRLFGAFQDITERRNAEEQLRYQAALLSNVNDAILASDAQYRITAWNSAAESLYGWKAEEVLGRIGLEIVRSEWPEADPEEMRRRIAESGRWRGEATQVRRDGTRFPVEVSSIVMRDGRGQITGYISVNRDITERKRAEEELRRARVELEQRVHERTRELANANRDLLNEIAERKEVERQLRIQTTAMQAAGNGIVITDRHGTIQWTNPAMALISGYAGRDLIGQGMQIFSSGQHGTDYYRQLWNTILAGQVWRGETINRRKDGTLYTEEQTITPVQSEHGVITHFIAIKQDITERKQAEVELERRNAELQIISAAEHKQRQFSEALVSAALVLNKSLKLDEVLTLILEQIRDVIPYQLADIALLDGNFFYDASHQGDLPWPSTLMGVNNRFLLDDFPLLSKMRQTGEPLLVFDSQSEPDWRIVDALAWTRSLLSVPLLAETKVIGFVNLFSDRPGFFTKEMSNRLVAFAVHAAVAIQNAWLFEQVRASTERLHSLSRRLVEIQETERHYISRELHDEAGQILTSLMVDLRLLEKNVSDPSALLKIIAEMEESLDAVSENLHRVAMALRPASLDHVGLVAALRQYTESLSEKNGLQVSFRAGEAVERLPSNVETVLYRIIQEALTNVIRHAHATRADVVLTVRDGKLIVLIEDDGVGFDPGAANKGQRLGLFGMRERAEMIGGKLTIESMPGKGTTVSMEVNYADTLIGRR